LAEEIQGTRFEAIILAFLYIKRDRGVDWDELEQVADRLSSSNVRSRLVFPPSDPNEVLDYVRFLLKLGVVEERDGRLYLYVNRLSPFMRRVIKELAERVDGGRFF